MTHNHAHDRQHNPLQAQKNIGLAFLLNFSFTIIELIGGLLTNSVAILADALHDAGDSLSLGLAWYFQRLSKKGRDQTFSYGYRRFSLLAAVINSLVLLLGSGFVLYEVIPRLWHPEVSNAKGMMILAVIGVLVNGVAVFRLKGGTSLNEKTVSLHLLEDVLGWVAVFIASVVMLYTDFYLLDPLLSVLITCYVLFNVFRNLYRSFKVLMQSVPDVLNEEKIMIQAAAIDGVKSIHDLHMWSLDGEYNVLTLHVVVADNCTQEQLIRIKNAVRSMLEMHQVHHATIELEAYSEFCLMENC